MTSCLMGFQDCDGNPVNGCEVDLRSDVSNCGSCRSACTLSHATGACMMGGCVLGACESGFANCDGIAANGCEVDLRSSPTHCGACLHVCPSIQNGLALCADSVCDARCAVGFHRCGDACVSDASPSTCGGSCVPCPAPANGVATCTGAGCGFVCNAGYRISGVECISNLPRWSQDRAFARAVTVTNPGSTTLTDYPVRLTLTATNFSFSDARSDGADVLPVTRDFGATLSYYLESWNAGSQTATLWVRVPSIPANSTATFQLLYGNPVATSLSTLAGRYEVYDDFRGPTLDTTQWTAFHIDEEGHGYPGSVSVTGGNLVVTGGQHHISDGVRSVRGFRAGGATLRAELFAWSRAGNSFCYSAPSFRLVNSAGQVDYDNSGDTYWPGPFQTLMGAPVEGGATRSGSATLALTYTPAIANVFIDDRLQGTVTAGLPADTADFNLVISIANPYSGATVLTIARVVVSRSVSPEPVAVVGAAIAR